MLTLTAGGGSEHDSLRNLGVGSSEKQSSASLSDSAAATTTRRGSCSPPRTSAATSLPLVLHGSASAGSSSLSAESTLEFPDTVGRAGARLKGPHSPTTSLRRRHAGDKAAASQSSCSDACPALQSPLDRLDVWYAPGQAASTSPPKHVKLPPSPVAFVWSANHLSASTSASRAIAVCWFAVCAMPVGRRRGMPGTEAGVRGWPAVRMHTARWDQRM
jgi:hypothetical protein